MSELSPEAREALRTAREAFSPSQAQIEAVRAVVDKQISVTGANTPPAHGLDANPGWASAKITGFHFSRLAIVGLTIGAVTVATVLLTRNVQPSAIQSNSIGRPVKYDKTSADNTNLPRKGSAVAIIGPNLPQNPENAKNGSVAPPSATDRRGSLPGNAHRRSNTAPPSRPSNPSQVQPPQQAPAELTVKSTTTIGDDASQTPKAVLSQEVALLRAARLAFEKGHAGEALAIVDRYIERFPQGILREEQMATRILALCALSRVKEARLEARKLETIASRSPHLARIRASCAGKPISH